VRFQDIYAIVSLTLKELRAVFENAKKAKQE